MYLGTLSAIGARFFISQANNLSLAKGLLYNSVEMLVSAVARKYLVFQKPATQDVQCLAPRFIAFLSASTITTMLLNPINVYVAVALNVSSWFIGAIVDMVSGNRNNGPQDLVFY